MADKPTIIKITCDDCGGFTEHEECEDCNGMGGYDASTDCEVYDDWQDCPSCEGRGYVTIGDSEKDVFVPERDALTPND